MSSTKETGRTIMVLEPTWQSFSSMYREAVSASNAATGMEISHHRTAALYFGIAALECLLNREMTRHQSRLGRGHDEINDLLRRPKFKIKLEKWPEETTGRPLQLRPKNGVRFTSEPEDRNERHQVHFETMDRRRCSNY